MGLQQGEAMFIKGEGSGPPTNPRPKSLKIQGLGGARNVRALDGSKGNPHHVQQAASDKTAFKIGTYLHDPDTRNLYILCRTASKWWNVKYVI
jgi:hypothetical protein